MVLTKKSSSSLRYKLLCGLLLLFLVVSGYTFYRQLPAALPASPAITRSAPAAPAISPGSVLVKPLPAAGYTFQNAVDAMVRYFNDHAALFVLIWFIVFMARFVQLLSGLVSAQRIRHYKTGPVPEYWQRRFAELLERLALTRPVLLLESALVKVPVAIGFLKPAILVPVGMLTHIAPDQVESILLHELAHIRRHDYLLNLVQNLVDTIFFFNPALIWISSLIRSERENCCDDIAIRETKSRRRLIEALVSFHEYERSVGGYALSFAARENEVVKRVKRIVHKKNHSLNVGERVVLMGGLLVLCAAFVTINNSRRAAPKTQPVSVHITDTPPVETRTTSVTPQMAKPAAAAPASTPAPVPAPAPARADTTPRTADTTTGTLPDPWLHAGVDKIIEARDHGVTTEFITGLQQLGYRNITLDQAIGLRDHGVTYEYISKLREVGFPNFTLSMAVELRDHGVSADYVLAMKKRFGKVFGPDDYIKLRDAGISPSSIEQQ